MALVFGLHRSLYAAEAVQAAAAAYAELARIEIQDADHEFTVAMDDIDADYAGHEEELADSFANHALFETIQRHRAVGP
jgi:hypothetical protein